MSARAQTFGPVPHPARAAGAQQLAELDVLEDAGDIVLVVALTIYDWGFTRDG